MKTSAILITAAAGLAAAQAPLPSNFPQCGVVCITNMLGLAGSFGCTPDNAQCLCSQINFVYGVRDCADQACPGGASGMDASMVKSFGVNYCYQAGIAISGIPASIVATGNPTTTLFATNSPAGSAASGGASVTGSGAPVVTTIVSTLTNAQGSPTGTMTIVSTLNAGGAGGAGSGGASGSGGATGSAGATGGAGGAGASSAVSTLPIVTTITSGGSTFTSTIGSTTIFAGGAGGAGSGSAISTLPIVTTITSGGSTFTSTIGSTTIFGSGAGAGSGASTMVSNSATVVTSGGSTFTTSVPVTQTSGPAGAASTSSSRAFAPQQTAAPMGFIAAAGLAALLL